MTFELTQKLLDRLSHHFDLGKIVSPPVFIPGGKLHQVWKLSAQKGDYALKRLEIDSTLSLVALYRETQKIAATFQQNNIPVVTALRHKGDPVCFLNNNYFNVKIIFRKASGEYYE